MTNVNADCFYFVCDDFDCDDVWMYQATFIWAPVFPQARTR